MANETTSEHSGSPSTAPPAPPRRRRLWIAIAAGIVLALFLLHHFTKEPAKTAGGRGQQGNATITVGQSRSGDIGIYVNALGTVTPTYTVTVYSQITGRVMADRSWRHGLHQAIEIKEGAPVTADKENLARLSFQRFFRQYPIMGGMTGTAWEARGELWQIYQRPIVRIPTNKPCIRTQLPLRMFDTADQKWEAVMSGFAGAVPQLEAAGLLTGERLEKAKEICRSFQALLEKELPEGELAARTETLLTGHSLY